jgi:hypothetical protein
LKLGSRDDAARLIDRAMSEVISKVGFDFPKIYPLISLGQLQLAKGDASSAVQTGRHALAPAERSTNRLEQGAVHRTLAQAYARPPRQLVQVDTLSVNVRRSRRQAVHRLRSRRPPHRRPRLLASHSALCAFSFLDKLVKAMPFKVTGIQVDGGSEFMAALRSPCRTPNTYPASANETLPRLICADPGQHLDMLRVCNLF